MSAKASAERKVRTAKSRESKKVRWGVSFRQGYRDEKPASAGKYETSILPAEISN